MDRAREKMGVGGVWEVGGGDSSWFFEQTLPKDTEAEQQLPSHIQTHKSEFMRKHNTKYNMRHFTTINYVKPS